MDSDAHFLHLLSLVKLDGLAERIGRLSNTESDSTGKHPSVQTISILSIKPPLLLQYWFSDIPNSNLA